MQKKTQDHPKDAAAWLAYANKLQQDSKLDEAAAALTTYTTLKPKNEDALRQLAAIYLRRASDWQTIYTFQQQRAPGSDAQPHAQPEVGNARSARRSARIPSPLASAVASAGNTVTGNAYQQFATALTQREDVWKKIAKLSPKDASTQLSLAQAAQDAADTKTAIVGYKAYLRPGPRRLGRPGGEEGVEAARGHLEDERKLQREDRQVNFARHEEPVSDRSGSVPLPLGDDRLLRPDRDRLVDQHLGRGRGLPARDGRPRRLVAHEPGRRRRAREDGVSAASGRGRSACW